VLIWKSQSYESPDMSVHHCRCIVLCFVSICQNGRFWVASLASGSSLPNEDSSTTTTTSI